MICGQDVRRVNCLVNFMNFLQPLDHWASTETIFLDAFSLDVVKGVNILSSAYWSADMQTHTQHICANAIILLLSIELDIFSVRFLAFNWQPRTHIQMKNIPVFFSHKRPSIVQHTNAFSRKKMHQFFSSKTISSKNEFYYFPKLFHFFPASVFSLPMQHIVAEWNEKKTISIPFMISIHSTQTQLTYLI